MTDSSQMEFPFPISSSEEAHAKTSVWLEAVLDWTENVVDSSESSLALLMSLPAGFSGRTSLELSRVIMEQTSPKSSVESSERFPKYPLGDGGTQELASDQTGSAFIACLTLNTSEFPNVVVESSLSEVIDPWREELSRYCFSQKAATGLLRRAKNNNHELGPLMKTLLLLTAEAERQESPNA